MPKRFSVNIGPRDLEILTALDRTPLTALQLCQLSQTFTAPFQDEHNLRRRLRKLAQSQLIKSWPYALATEGRSPRYFKLTREGYRLLHGMDSSLPRRRYFEEISHGHHHHTFSLAEAVVQIEICAHQEGFLLRHFARENSCKLSAGEFTMYPDCAFQLLTSSGQGFNFVVELDNSTERVRTKQDIESIERKLRGYDAHQSQFKVNDPKRYLVIFITTRSQQRLNHILALAEMVVRDPQRTTFIGTTLSALLKNNPFRVPILENHRHLKRTLIPHAFTKSSKQQQPQTECLLNA